MHLYLESKSCVIQYIDIIKKHIPVLLCTIGIYFVVFSGLHYGDSPRAVQ